MKKGKQTGAQKERARVAAARPIIIKEITRLERAFGESTVSGAYNRHRAVARERRKLTMLRRESAAKIAKLRA